MTLAFGFGAAVAALFVAALALATRPWWLRSSSTVRRRRANVAAYKTRLLELDAELAAGLTAPAEAEALKQELAVHVLADTNNDEATPVAAPTIRPRRWVIGLAALLLAAFAAGGYWLDGSWRLQQQIANRAESAPKVAEMIQKLADRLQQQPDDPTGWSLLGQSYFVLQRFADAAQAYHEANVHAPSPNAEWLTDEGEALAFVDEQNLGAQSAALFDQALQLQPDLGKALWYGGLAAAQRGNAARARMLWAALAREDLPESMRAVLQERMTALDGTSAPAGSSATEGSASAAAVSLPLRITIAPALADKIPRGATLLVFAKADGGSPTGSPAVQGMPLAVQRVPDPKLPLSLTLDDSQAMMPAMKLSLFDRYEITARLSQAGMAQAASGDLQGSIKAARTDSGTPKDLVIDSIVP